MKKTEKRIKIILDELNKARVNKTALKNKKDFCVINLTFPVRNFYKKVGSVGDFLKKLRNNLPYNRPFFNRISNNGIYNYTIDDENVIINIFIELNEIFEKSELAPKILKLVEPSKMIISFNDDELYKETFKDKFIICNWGLWGLFRSLPFD
jgi:hypothetical protein